MRKANLIQLAAELEALGPHVLGDLDTSKSRRLTPGFLADPALSGYPPRS